ncbi:MAG: hypothetical protein JWM12_2948 [Ilumatobacteraceae bacterium]|nr:hypothetical protein [Ilumatobacteraceae bacterium]
MSSAISPTATEIAETTDTSDVTEPAETSDTSDVTEPAAVPRAFAASAAASALPDLRRQLDDALALAAGTLAAIGPDELDRPTPCTDLDVRGLARHLLAAVRRITVVGRGEHFATVGHQVEVTDDEIVPSFGAAAAELHAVWSDETLLDRMLTLPFGTTPGRVALGVYLAEVSTHTWDLAVATGQSPEFDDAAIEVAAAVVRVGIPADGREGIPFAPVRPVASDAPAIDRLVAWEGRDPAWRTVTA